ncbi:MAG: 3-hydroxybutyrate dehydrogenase [Gammaproteobacteria bacterium]|nr:3-hydroxybutyrate dehydrogenase [Gammaproteobacteria bacterium]
MLKNKVALITGSTSGIGLATAKVLARKGINLVINGLMSDEEGSQLARELETEFAIKVMFDGANLAEPKQIETMIRRAIDTLGSIDILVNNAGIQHTSPIEKFPTDKWNDIIAINLSSAFHTTQGVLSSMNKNKWGRIINIASVHGLVGSVNKSAYVAAKHGLVGLTKVSALELASSGITVNAICPGWVETPLINQQIEDIAAQQNIDISQAKEALITAKQPLPEMASPAQIGEFILFLCSNAASSITGASLPIDGAWTAQ